MSDNNGKNNGRKDSFAVPGDESIVSGGKSFFLSFGKPKKGPANPLIESEKQKAARDGGNANNANNGNNGNSGNNNGNGGRNDHHNRRGKKHDAPRSDKPSGDKAPERAAAHDSQEQSHDNNQGGGKKQKFGKGRHDRDRSKGQKPEAESMQGERTSAKPVEKAPEKSEGKREDGGKGRNDRRGKGDRRGNNGNNGSGGNDNQRKSDKQNGTPEAPEQQGKRDGQGQKHGDRRGKDNGVGNNNGESSKGKNDRRGNKGQDKSRREEAPAASASTDSRSARPKHKKEKFVPTAPGQPLTDDSLLQPIVNRTGIISGGTSGAFSSSTRSKYGIGAFTGETDNTVYIDKARPLAEQIAERSRPQVFNRAPENVEDSVEVIGVRFRDAGKVYYFAPGNCKVEKDEAVIVETARGVEYGFCAIANRRVKSEDIVAPLKPILRKATNADTELFNSNKALEETASTVFKEKVAMLKLEMVLIYVEYTFDKGKLLFYFTADGRVDFRELIKELAQSFPRTRIELRQIGVRDEAKIVGGLGICGRPVCCKTFLGEFSQVSIKMAKDQNLFLNAAKISGTCGRYMCCLRYEDEVYQKGYENTPKVDAIVETESGKGIVVESNALKGTVKVLLDDEPDSAPKLFKGSEVTLVGYLKNDAKDLEDTDSDIEELPEE